jgi:hypothetical protein
MTDNELIELLPDYIRGQLDDATESEIKTRLEISEELRMALDRARRYIDSLEALEPALASDNFLREVHERIEARQRVFNLLFRPFHIKLPVELAGIAATVILVVFMFNPFSGKLPDQIQRRPIEEHRILRTEEPAPPVEPEPSETADGHTPVTEKKSAPEPVEKKPSGENKAVAKLPEKRQSVKKRAPTKAKKIKKTANQKSVQDVRGKSETRDETVKHLKEPSAYPTQSLHRTIPAPAVRARSLKSAQPAAPSPNAGGVPMESPEMSDYDAADESAEFERIEEKAKSAPEKTTRRKKERSVKPEGYMGVSSAEASLPLPPKKLTVKDSTMMKIKRIAPRFEGVIDSVLEMNDTYIKLRMILPDRKVISFQSTLSKALKPSLFSSKELASDGKKVTLLVDIEIIK